jgi:hypothetical protein
LKSYQKIYSLNYSWILALMGSEGYKWWESEQRLVQWYKPYE